MSVAYRIFPFLALVSVVLIIIFSIVAIQSVVLIIIIPDDVLLSVIIVDYIFPKLILIYFDVVKNTFHRKYKHQ